MIDGELVGPNVGNDVSGGDEGESVTTLEGKLVCDMVGKTVGVVKGTTLGS